MWRIERWWFYGIGWDIWFQDHWDYKEFEYKTVRLLRGYFMWRAFTIWKDRRYVGSV